MKKNIPVILFLSMLPCCTFSQDIKQGKIQIDAKRPYTVARESAIDLIRSFDNLSDTVRAEIILNGNPIHVLEYEQTTFKNDTLTIEFLNHDPAWDNHLYKIICFHGGYSIDYTFFSILDEVPKNRVFKTLKSQVILNTNDFKRGLTLRGFMSYEGKCVSGCEPGKTSIIYRLQGNFTVKVP